MNTLDILRKYVPVHAERVSETLQLLIRIALRSIGADEGSLLLVSEDRKNLVFTSTVGKGQTKLTGTTIPIGFGITGMAALTQDVQIGSKAAQTMKSVPGDSDPNSVVAVPLVADDELIGVLTLVRLSRSEPFNLEDGELYLMLGAVAATVLHQQHLLDTTAAACEIQTEKELSRQKIMTEVSELIDRHPQAQEPLSAMIKSLSAVCK